MSLANKVLLEFVLFLISLKHNDTGLHVFEPHMERELQLYSQQIISAVRSITFVFCPVVWLAPLIELVDSVVRNFEHPATVDNTIRRPESAVVP